MSAQDGVGLERERRSERRGSCWSLSENVLKVLWNVCAEPLDFAGFLIFRERSLTSQVAKTFDQISLFLKITAEYEFRMPKKPICSAESLRLENLGYCADKLPSLALRANENTWNIRAGWTVLSEIPENWTDFLLVLHLCK